MTPSRTEPLRRLHFKSFVDASLRVQPFVTNRELARSLGISRQAIHRQLRAMVEKGQLVVEGAGRSLRYRRPGREGRDWALLGRTFWEELMVVLPGLLHLEMRSLRRSMVTRADGRDLANALDLHHYVVFDFKGVKKIGPGFADQLFRKWAAQKWPCVHAINMAPSIEALVAP